MESGRNINSFFPSNGISSLLNVVPAGVPYFPIYRPNSQGAKSTIASGNEGCSVEIYNEMIGDCRNDTKSVEFYAYLIQCKNAKLHQRRAEGGHRWHQKTGPYLDKYGWTCRDYILSHGTEPCRKNGSKFKLVERIDPRLSLNQPVAVHCTLTREGTSTISPAVVPSGDVNSYFNYQGSTSILSGAPIMSMAADSTARMPIVPPGDVYSSLTDAFSSFNCGHHHLVDSGAYMSTEVNSFPASMPRGNIWSSFSVSPGRPGIVNDYHLGGSYGTVGEDSFPLMDSANGMEPTWAYSTHDILGTEAAPEEVSGVPQPMEPMSHDSGYYDVGIGSTANETNQHDFAVPFIEPTSTVFGTSEYTLANESGDYNWGDGYVPGWLDL